MIGESLAIIAVILVMSAMAARRGKHLFFAFTLPLICVPLFHLAAWVLRLYHLSYLFDIAGFVVGAVSCGVKSRVFPSRTTRLGYFFFCLFFMGALLTAYLLSFF